MTTVLLLFSELFPHIPWAFSPEKKLEKSASELMDCTRAAALPAKGKRIAWAPVAHTNWL